MLPVAGWTFALYAVLKLCHLVLGAKTTPDRQPIPLVTRLRAGEPGLLAGTVAAAALLMSYTGWWSHKFHAGHYAYASACYPPLAAAGFLPGGRARLASYNAAQGIRELRDAAEEQGAALGLDPATVGRTLEAARLAHVRRNTALAAGGAPAAVAAARAEIDRCQSGRDVPRGEILHPV